MIHFSSILVRGAEILYMRRDQTRTLKGVEKQYWWCIKELGITPKSMLNKPDINYKLGISSKKDAEGEKANRVDRVAGGEENLKSEANVQHWLWQVRGEELPWVRCISHLPCGGVWRLRWVHGPGRERVWIVDWCWHSKQVVTLISWPQRWVKPNIPEERDTEVNTSNTPLPPDTHTVDLTSCDWGQRVTVVIWPRCVHERVCVLACICGF